MFPRGGFFHSRLMSAIRVSFFPSILSLDSMKGLKEFSDTFQRPEVDVPSLTSKVMSKRKRVACTNIFLYRFVKNHSQYKVKYRYAKLIQIKLPHM